MKLLKLSNLKIGTRLGLAFAALALMLLLSNAIGLSMLGRVNQGAQTALTVNVARTAQANAALDQLNVMAIALRNMMLTNADADRQRERARIGEARQALDAVRAKLRTAIERKEVLARLRDIDTAYTRIADELMAAIEAGQIEFAQQVLNDKLRPTFAAYKETLDDVIAYQGQLNAQAAADAAQTFERSRIELLGLAALALLLAVAMGFLITRSITRPLAQALELARRVAKGDLSGRVQARGGDEAAELLRALGEMNDSLVHIVSQVRTSSESIASGSTQIAVGNTDLSQRTEEQAANLEQTAASMEQLGAAVRNNDDAARQAAQLSSAAAQVAARGQAAVAQVVQMMARIDESSRRIGDIIGTIDGIAFQTNILALNAAVEAARAGEAGRGFAVVAGEVRTLARHAADAAKEIKTLIGQSTETVAAGNAIVADTGSTMSDILTQVQRVSDLVGDISAASAEQTQGIGQVGDAVTQLDQVTQQNASLVEESAAAAESLRLQAARLAELVAVFRLGGATTPA